jgi:hypothetical protein
MLCNGSRDLHRIDIGDPPETKTSLMGRKNKANKACVQTLAIARERKAILEKNKHTLLRDQRNRHHRDRDCTLDPTFVTDSLEPELPPDNIQSEDADENIETEDSPEQVLENPGHIHNGLSDPDESPDDADIVDDSDLRQFVSALQEAQRRAVQLESELTKTKHRTPKMY